jgi:peptidoglycan/LPS O-acetylase OafA/YrhL
MAMKYYEKIDGLRFVAISLVLVEHFADTIGHKISAGYYAVDLFFVISGFLITNILLKSKGSFLNSYKNFVGRRTLRIFPIYYLMLFIMLMIGYKPCCEYILFLASYTFNYAWVHYNIEMNALSHFWSLAIEEQFYLFWPIFILAFRNKPKVLFITTGIIIAVSFFQMTTSFFTIVNPYNFVGLFPRIGSLCLGALGGMLFHHKRLNEQIFRSIIVEWTVFIVLIISMITSYDLKYFILALCSFYLVLKSVHSDFSIGFINRFLSNKKVVYIGTISYGIYIYHLPIGFFITTIFVEPWWYSIKFESLGFFSFVQNCLWIVLLPFYALLSIGVAALSSRFIEKPILSLKDKWFR